MSVTTLIEKKRGCGYRKKGGIYLIGGTDFAGCCKLPFPLTVCSCCGAGVKFSRGFTWINSKLFTGGCSRLTIDIASNQTVSCVMSEPDTKLGLMWVGETNYKSPGDFAREAKQIGISKRISQIPKECVPGQTWIALAHNKAVSVINEAGNATADLVTFTPGVFLVFLVKDLQYVVHGSETPEELERLEKRGLHLVNVIPEGEPVKLF